MKRRRSADSKNHAGGDRICAVRLAPVASGIVIAGYFDRASFVYQPLTSIRKDCGTLAKAHQRASSDNSSMSL
jgi:hypothetical protein